LRAGRAEDRRLEKQEKGDRKRLETGGRKEED